MATPQPGKGTSVTTKYGTITITPKPSKHKGPPSERVAFQQLLNKYPQWKKYGQIILQAAKNYNMDAPSLLSTLIYENRSANPNTQSSVGAIGLAQIFDNQAAQTNAAGVPFFRPGNLNISPADKADPTFAINYMAWRMGGYMNAPTPQDLNTAYGNYYGSQNFPTQDIGHGPAAVLSGVKNYQPVVTKTPTATAGQSAATTAAKTVNKPLQDPWVVLKTDKHGNVTGIRYDTSPTPPKNVLHFNGLPVPRSAFAQYQSQSADDYMAYSGKPPTPVQVATAMRNNWELHGYQLRQSLVNKPSFIGSPTWQHLAPGYQAAWQNVMGDNSKPPVNLMKQAAANNWDSTTFQYEAMKLPQYTKSANFRNATAGFIQGYQKIYGAPDENAKTAAQQAAAAGWNDNQWNAWLRGQPAYQHSAEYQSQILQILDKLGMDFGFVPQFGPAPPQTGGQTTTPGEIGNLPTPLVPGGSMVLPNDPRLPAAKPITPSGPTEGWKITAPVSGQ